MVVVVVSCEDGERSRSKGGNGSRGSSNTTDVEDSSRCCPLRVADDDDDAAVVATTHTDEEGNPLHKRPKQARDLDNKTWHLEAGDKQENNRVQTPPPHAQPRPMTSILTASPMSERDPQASAPTPREKAPLGAHQLHFQHGDLHEGPPHQQQLLPLSSMASESATAHTSAVSSLPPPPPPVHVHQVLANFPHPPRVGPPRDLTHGDQPALSSHTNLPSAHNPLLNITSDVSQTYHYAIQPPPEHQILHSSTHGHAPQIRPRPAAQAPIQLSPPPPPPPPAPRSQEPNIHVHRHSPNPPHQPHHHAPPQLHHFTPLPHPAPSSTNALQQMLLPYQHPHAPHQPPASQPASMNSPNSSNHNNGVALHSSERALHYRSHYRQQYQYQHHRQQHHQQHHHHYHPHHQHYPQPQHLHLHEEHGVGVSFQQAHPHQQPTASFHRPDGAHNVFHHDHRPAHLPDQAHHQVDDVPAPSKLYSFGDTSDQLFHGTQHNYHFHAQQQLHSQTSTTNAKHHLAVSSTGPIAAAPPFSESRDTTLGNASNDPTLQQPPPQIASQQVNTKDQVHIGTAPKSKEACARNKQSSRKEGGARKRRQSARAPALKDSLSLPHSRVSRKSDPRTAGSEALLDSKPRSLPSVVRHNSTTIAQRFEAVQSILDGKKTQVQVAKEMGVGKTAVANWVKKARMGVGMEYMAIAATSKHGVERRRVRAPKYPDVDQAVLAFLQERREHAQRPSWTTILGFAQGVAARLVQDGKQEYGSFRASAGWYQRLRRRYDLDAAPMASPVSPPPPHEAQLVLKDLSQRSARQDAARLQGVLESSQPEIRTAPAFQHKHACPHERSIAPTTPSSLPSGNAADTYQRDSPLEEDLPGKASPSTSHAPHSQQVPNCAPCGHALPPGRAWNSQASDTKVIVVVSQTS